MFDEVVLRANLAVKISPGQLVVARFGLERVNSLVAISQSLDKLIVHESVQKTNELARLSNSSPFDASELDDRVDNLYYIRIRDIIKSLAARSNVDRQGRDLLLIGCVNSLIIYDPIARVKLLNINTSGPVELICGSDSTSYTEPLDNYDETKSIGYNHGLIVFAGSQKLHTVKLEDAQNQGEEKYATPNGGGGLLFSGELTSERSTSDSMLSLVEGPYRFLNNNNDNMENEQAERLVITGTHESNIHFWPVDDFDQNLRACQMSIEESGPVVCLCPIFTLELGSEGFSNTDSDNEAGSNRNLNQNNSIEAKHKSNSVLLPSITDSGQSAKNPHLDATSSKRPTNMNSELLSHFAFGLGTNYLGVYRIFVSRDSPIIDSSTANSGQINDVDPLTGLQKSRTTKLQRERLWFLKCRHRPRCLLMYDMNGDGQDELVVGFQSGRLEVREPFTGHLLAATRSFRGSDQLVGLASMDLIHGAKNNSRVLVAVSTSGCIVCYKPRFSLPRKPLLQLGYPDTPAPMNSHMILHDDNQSHLLSELSEGAIEMESLIRLSDLNDKRETIHIETRAHNTKPTRTEAKQNLNLLHKLNTLEAEKLELENEAATLLRDHLELQAKLLPSDISISHRWDFDMDKNNLRLSIFIRSQMEQLRMIEIHDTDRLFLTEGTQLINVNDLAVSKSTKGSVSRMISLALNANRDSPTELMIRVYCNSPTRTASSGLSRLCSYLINVPKYSTYIMAPCLEELQKITVTPGNQPIRLVYSLADPEFSMNQLIDWTNSSFLCLQFGSDINHNFQSYGHRFSLASRTSLSSDNNFTLIDIPTQDNPTEYELQLVDVKRSIDEATDSRLTQKPTRTIRLAISQGRLELETHNPDLMMDLIQNLTLDSDKLIERKLGPLPEQLDELIREETQLRESEFRIQSELYESADYTRQLIDQLTIAIELNEFSTGKDLLNELSIMFNGTQNAAQSHKVNSDSRSQLTKQIQVLKSTIRMLEGGGRISLEDCTQS